MRRARLAKANGGGAGLAGRGPKGAKGVDEKALAYAGVALEVKRCGGYVQEVCGGEPRAQRLRVVVARDGVKPPFDVGVVLRFNGGEAYAG